MIPMWSTKGQYTFTAIKQSNLNRFKKFCRPVVFTALHAMQTRSSDENSLRLSVKRVIVTKWKKHLSRFVYHKKEHLAKFTEKKNGWWGDPFYLKFWVNRAD